MEAILKKDNIVETEDDIKNIKSGLDDIKNGRTMDVDTAMKKFFVEREVWKSIIK